MPRAPRVDQAGYCYHVVNRANARFRMFRKDDDFAAFERVLGEAVARADGSVRLLAYCITQRGQTPFLTQHVLDGVRPRS